MNYCFRKDMGQDREEILAKSAEQRKYQHEYICLDGGCSADESGKSLLVEDLSEDRPN